MKVTKRKRPFKGLVFNGSAGWLLFWLIIFPPAGYIWLFLNITKGEIIKGEIRR